MSAVTWRRTGDDDFPVAAQDGRTWIVLRVNDEPQHPTYTIFRNGMDERDIVDWPVDELGQEPDFFAAKLTAPQRAQALASVKGLRRYGAELGDPCPLECCASRAED